MSIMEGKIIDGQVAFFALHNDFMRYLDTFDLSLSLWDSTIRFFFPG